MVTINSYFYNAVVCIKALSNTIFLTVDDIPVPTTVLMKLVILFMTVSGASDSKVPILNL